MNIDLQMKHDSDSGEEDFAGLIELEHELIFLEGRKTHCTIIAAQLKDHSCQVPPTGVFKCPG
jgi:hypothetical protein